MLTLLVVINQQIAELQRVEHGEEATLLNFFSILPQLRDSPSSFHLSP